MKWARVYSAPAALFALISSRHAFESAAMVHTSQVTDSGGRFFVAPAACGTGNTHVAVHARRASLQRAVYTSLATCSESGGGGCARSCRSAGVSSCHAVVVVVGSSHCACSIESGSECCGFIDWSHVMQPELLLLSRHLSDS